MKFIKFLIKIFGLVFGFTLLILGFARADEIAWLMFPTTIFGCYFIGSNLDIFMIDKVVNKQ